MIFIKLYIINKAFEFLFYNINAIIYTDYNIVIINNDI